MNHGIKHRKFGRRSEHRAAMLMNLVKSLVKHGRIFTTLPKAKDLRPIAERIITISKKDELSARRRVISFMRGNCPEVTKLFGEIGPKVKNRNGGYLRILKVGHRSGDAAPMAMIEFVDSVQKQ